MPVKIPPGFLQQKRHSSKPKLPGALRSPDGLYIQHIQMYSVRVHQWEVTLMKTTTVRIDDTILERVDNLARTLSRSRSWVINQAIDRFLDYEEWFVKEVENGLAEVEKGEIATRDEIEAKFRKWGVNAG